MRDTIDMAREADLIDDTFASDWYVYQLKAFEALVRADERNRTWTQEHWTDYERSIAAAEREMCAKLVDDIEARCIAKDVDDPPLKNVAAAIRARLGDQK
jgi:hypothetical protein